MVQTQRTVFLLGNQSVLTNETARWVILILAFTQLLLFALKGLTQGLSTDLIPYFLAGLFLLVYRQVAYFDTAYSAKVVISDQSIIVKPKLFKTAREFQWEKLRGINISPGQLHFQFSEKEKVISFETIPETEAAINKKLKELAKEKEISIV